MAIDVGTSMLRCSLVTTHGEVTATAAEPAERPSADGGLDVEAIWRRIVRLVRSLGPAAGLVQAVGVSGQLSLVLVDGDGHPTRPGLAWSDRRAAAETEELTLRLGPGRRVTGRRLHPEQWAAKLLWLQRHEPEAVERARWALSLKDYLVMRLTGTAATDETHASYTSLFDVQARDWAPDVIGECGIDSRLLPMVAAAASVAGGLTPDSAADLLLGPGTPVAVGGPDGTLGAVGAGAVRRGVTVDVAGSTDVLLHVLDEPRTDPNAQAVLNAHAAPDLWTIGGPTGMTGGAITWIAQLLGVGTAELYERWGEAAAELEPGASGLLFVTTLTGGRFPDWNPETAASIRGLAPFHMPPHLVRAAEEGAAFVVLEGIAALDRLGCQIDEITVVGGAAVRPPVLQLRADVWSVPVRSLGVEQASTLGAAALAITAAGLTPSLAESVAAMFAPGRTYEPDPTRTDALRAVFERWRSRERDVVSDPAAA